jgi:Ca2+-binding RTX toxin-like protein
MGTTAADILTGSDDADIIWGLGDNDRLQGQAGDDTLVGGTGNDFLLGGAGNDRIIGVDGSADNAGAYERDFLRGDAGQDWFVLGDADQAFYVEADGLEGAAILLDFDRMADTIELHGSADRYRLEQSSGYTRILYGSTGTPTELIAIVLRDFANLDLNAEYFSYA